MVGRLALASFLFNISRNTINLWLSRQAKTGDFEALPNQPKGNGYKISAGGKLSSGKLKLMEIKPKSRWPHCGMSRSVSAPDRER